MNIDEAAKGKQIRTCADLREAAAARQSVVCAAFSRPMAAAFVLNMTSGMWTFIKPKAKQ